MDYTQVIGKLSIVAILLSLASGCIPCKPEPIDGSYAPISFTPATELPEPDTKPEIISGNTSAELPAPPMADPVPEFLPVPVRQQPQPTPQVSYRNPAQRIHIVQRGQTLWKIARMYYGRANADLVAQIVAANSEIENPNLIYPGQELIIP